MKLLQEIPLGEAEQAAIEEGVSAYERLTAKVDVPTSADQHRDRSIGASCSLPAYRSAASFNSIAEQARNDEGKIRSAR
jgi:hypothetical protein